jgi:hypothetical protein
MNELRTPILIVGGGAGGVAAALAVARAGGSCIVTEPTDWIGGQLTSQSVPPDENRWIEGDDPRTRGANASYIALRDAVRSWYRANRPLTEAARANPRLNPGNGWVSHLCAEPRVIHACLQEMLAPHVSVGRIRILFGYEPVSADVVGDRVRAVTFEHRSTRESLSIAADFVLDASELGELLPLTGAEHAVGAEHRDRYGEMHGHPDRDDPDDVQAISWCFAIEHRPGEDHTIPRPARYDFWRDFIPHFDVPWPGKLFGWTVLGAEGREHRLFRFVPWPDEPKPNEWEMWRYRRIVDRSLYRPESASEHPDVSLINMVQMDYFLKSTLKDGRRGRDEAFAEAREQSLCLLYWMQTEAPRLDGSDKVGFPGLRLRGEELGTSDGFAMHPYIREARRLIARTIVTEAHVGYEQRKAEKRPGMDVEPLGCGEPFPDSVGIGHYRLDLHPSCGGRHGVYAQSTPFRIPLGALIPVRMTNLLASGKCLGVTHVTNGGYRLHPVEWAIGEAAGALAQWCVAGGEAPVRVHEHRSELRAFQKHLLAFGAALSWPWESGAGLE